MQVSKPNSPNISCASLSSFFIITLILSGSGENRTHLNRYYLYSFVLFLVAKQVELQLYIHMYTVYYHIIYKQYKAVEKTTSASHEYWRHNDFLVSELTLH